MEYINDTREVVAAQSESPRVKLVHSKVEQIRRSEKCGVKYMQKWEEIAYAREDGYEEGRNEGALKESLPWQHLEMFRKACKINSFKVK